MSKETLREATRKVAAAARHHLGPHLSPEELLAYHGGELSSTEEARVHEHLALCPECTATVLDLAAFPKVELRPGAAGPLEDLIPPWEEVQERLDAREKEAEGGSRFEVLSHKPQVSKPWVALAAGLFLAAVGLTVAVVVLEGKLERQEAARGDLPLFTLAAQGISPTRGEERIEVPGERFNLMLYAADPGSYPRYHLEAVTGAGQDEKVIWSLEPLEPTPEGLFLITSLSAGELPPARYTIRLFGHDAEGPVLLAEFPVVIAYDQAQGP